jgi:hypothetical protein
MPERLMKGFTQEEWEAWAKKCYSIAKRRLDEERMAELADRIKTFEMLNQRAEKARIWTKKASAAYAPRGLSGPGAEAGAAQKRPQEQTGAKGARTEHRKPRNREGLSKLDVEEHCNRRVLRSGSEESKAPTSATPSLSTAAARGIAKVKEVVQRMSMAIRVTEARAARAKAVEATDEKTRRVRMLRRQEDRARAQKLKEEKFARSKSARARTRFERATAAAREWDRRVLLEREEAARKKELQRQEKRKHMKVVQINEAARKKRVHEARRAVLTARHELNTARDARRRAHVARAAQAVQNVKALRHRVRQQRERRQRTALKAARMRQEADVRREKVILHTQQSERSRLEREEREILAALAELGQGQLELNRRVRRDYVNENRSKIATGGGGVESTISKKLAWRTMQARGLERESFEAQWAELAGRGILQIKTRRLLIEVRERHAAATSIQKLIRGKMTRDADPRIPSPDKTSPRRVRFAMK